jgi:hypothetical protein
MISFKTSMSALLVFTHCSSYSLLSKQDNPFHNFHHAISVTMSVSKLLARIVAPEMSEDEEVSRERAYHAKLHDTSYGITSDPLTQFAVIFSAMMHDVDHPG